MTERSEMAKSPKPKKGLPLTKEQQKANQEQIAKDKVRKHLGLKAAWEMLATQFMATARPCSKRDPSYLENPEPERSCLMKSIAIRHIMA